MCLQVFACVPTYPNPIRKSTKPLFNVIITLGPINYNCNRTICIIYITYIKHMYMVFCIVIWFLFIYTLL